MTIANLVAGATWHGLTKPDANASTEERDVWKLAEKRSEYCGGRVAQWVSKLSNDDREAIAVDLGVTGEVERDETGKVTNDPLKDAIGIPGERDQESNHLPEEYQSRLKSQFEEVVVILASKDESEYEDRVEVLAFLDKDEYEVFTKGHGGIDNAEIKKRIGSITSSIHRSVSRDVADIVRKLNKDRKESERSAESEEVPTPTLDKFKGMLDMHKDLVA